MYVNILKKNMKHIASRDTFQIQRQIFKVLNPLFLHVYNSDNLQIFYYQHIFLLTDNIYVNTVNWQEYLKQILVKCRVHQLYPFDLNCKPIVEIYEKELMPKVKFINEI